MPPKIVNIYLTEKYKHETALENYITDMLWAPANSMVYKKCKRYSELYTVNNEPELNGEEILNELLNAW